jgi:hypothetical protein
LTEHASISGPVPGCRTRENKFSIREDMVSRLRAYLDRDGEILHGRGGTRENPLLKHELQYRSFVVRSLIKLGVNAEPLRQIGRPSKPFNYA